MSQGAFDIIGMNQNDWRTWNFVDYIALFGNTIEYIKEMTDRLARDALKIRINIDKPKLMHAGYRSTSTSTNIGHTELFTYLGSVTTSDRDSSKMLHGGKTGAIFQKLSGKTNQPRDHLLNTVIVSKQDVEVIQKGWQQAKRGSVAMEEKAHRS